jgi:hypothetical protein
MMDRAECGHHGSEFRGFRYKVRRDSDSSNLNEQTAFPNPF